MIEQTEVGEAHWASCLVVVVAYDDVAPAVSASVSQAMERLRLSPALDDFIELRFVAGGPRPGAEEEPDSLGGTILHEVARPTRGAPENYFGLVAVDDRPESVAGLLELCGGTLSEHELDVLSKGFAVKMPDRDAAQPPAPITILGSRPHLEDRLAVGIRDFCEDLMRRYADGAVKGITPAALGTILAPEVISEPAADETFTALSAASTPSGTSSSDADLSVTNAHADARGPRQGALAKPEPGAEARPGSPATPVFIAVVGMHSGGRRDWRRVRSIVRGLDKHLAEPDAHGGFFVGVVPARPSARPALQPAGVLHRRDLPRADDFSDFAQHLTSLKKALELGYTDLTRRGRQTAKPKVVFLSLEAPVGDAISSELYREVNGQTSIVWLLIGEADFLLPPVFAEGAIVIRDYPGALHELLESVTAGDADLD